MNADLIRFSIALDVVVPGTYQPDVCPSGAVTAVTASGEGGLPLGDNPSCSGLITSGRYT